MVEEHELLALVIGLSVALVAAANRRALLTLPRADCLTAAFMMFLAGWTCNVVENFFFPVIINYVEHAAYLCGSLTLLFWAKSVASDPGE